jgi:hypothetical protein
VQLTVGWGFSSLPLREKLVVCAAGIAMPEKNGNAISRREFARRAGIASAVALVPATVLTSHAPQSPAPPEASGAQLPDDLPKLSAESQVEAEARYQTILRQFGSRFSEEQKTDLRRLCALSQRSLDHLRAYAVENGDGVALYLKPVVEREKKPVAMPTAGTGKKP